jgi:L-cysteine S-thiosulfotransferase
MGLPAMGAEIPPAERRSDTVMLAPETRAMQADDAANPGMLAVLEGETLWSAPVGREGKACAACHGAAEAMRGVAARYPAWDAGEGRPVDLAGRVNLCRTRHQGAESLPPESPGLLALTALLGHASRGAPITPPDDPGMRAARARGRALFTARQGQLNLACASCHDDNWGRKLAGSPIPQGHPVGYPIYRLEWQATGSLQRRLRNCLAGVRAEPYPLGAPELVDLESYLMERAAGLPLETPAVRP